MPQTRAQSQPAGLDVAQVSATLGVPESDVQTLLDAPTTELVESLLLKLEVTLEHTVRTSEAKVKSSKSSLVRHAKETEELREKLNEAESARENLSAELEQLRSSTSGSTAETQGLRQRIETLEASNRDTLALVENKSSEKDRVATELSEQHSKLITLRREVSQLEDRNQTLENAASTQKFKEQSLQQEIDLLKRNNEWHSGELQTRNQEYAKFRKERNARIASLQRELEDTNANVDLLKRTETSLRQRLDEVQGKADEAFSRIASLEEESTRREQSWKSELDSSKRLAELQAQNAATHKARLQNIQEQLEDTKRDATEEVGRLQAEVETERADKEQAEGKVAELELRIEHLEQQPRASRPATPMHNGPFGPSTPGRMGSPFTFAGSARKSGRPFTNTEYVSKINELQQDLEAERRRTKKLADAMDDMVADAETSQPALEELQEEHARLEEEVVSFSRLLEDSNATRDEAVKEVERWQADSDSKLRESEILRQQLRDLSAQVKILLVEIQVRDQGLEGMSGSERFQLEQAARGESEAWSENETMTNQFISQKLVIFRDVSQLQEQNQHLLQITRDLGERMEGQEARKKAAESEANAQEAEQLRQQVDRYKDELQATATQIDSYIKERDMFRRMLQHRGQLASDADYEAMFARSIPPATPQRNGNDPVAQTPRSKDVDDMNKLLKEQQTFFDQYRNESAQDRKMLKDQVDALGKEKSTLLADVAHWKSQKTLAEERLQMVQANYNGLRSENTELQKRSQEMAENAAKQDLRTQQVAEELIEARSMAESLRHENANCKAERELWKRIETRLTEHNQELLDERSRLNKLVSDLQSLQNERELSDSENRRRLQGRVESLESELADAKKKLDQELEDSRRATLRREYDEGQSRQRIDDLVKSLGNVREELVAAKTTRDQLQTRIDEMKIELRSAEERAAALQPRPTPREPQLNGERRLNGETEELPTEQRLALEISDLRRDLELARNELESAKQQVEQYRAISQATEEELANFNETTEQYKEDVDRQIVEKDTRASELQQRVDDLSAELNTTNSELSELRTKHDDSSRALEEQKTNSEAEVTRLRDDASRYTAEKKLYQEDLKAQAEIAQQAQQSYEDELLKHAEAAKNLQSVRKEYHDLRTEVAGIRSEAEAAKASLERGEESWTEQRDRFERELEEAKTRRQGLDEQNRLLHQQMESFSSELAALRTGRSATLAGGDERASTPSGDSNMQDVVKYLRREKEIVDVQYELSVQENKRLQQQLDYANGQLEETRQKLAEERRQSSDKLVSEGNTTKLLEQVNELNLYRESATALRLEARQAREKLEERSKEIERLLSEIEPLKSRVGDLEGDMEGKDGEIKLLQDDRDHWRERTQNIISKYDRVDPAEIEDMKKRLEDLQTEKASLEAEQGPLREQVEGMDRRIETAVEENSKPLRDKLEKFREQAKEQNRKQVAKIKEGETAIGTANAEKARVEEELESVKKELEETRSTLQIAQSRVSTTQDQDTEEGQVQEEQNSSGDQTAAETKTAQAEQRATDQSNRAETLSAEVQVLQTRVQELEGQVSTLQQQLDNALQGEEGEIQGSGSGDAEALENLRQDLATAQQEVETLRANANHAGPNHERSTNVVEGPTEQPNVAEQVAAEVAKLRAELEEQHELAKKQLEEERDRRLEGMKNQLSRKLKEEKDKLRDTVRQEVLEEHSAELQKLRDEHDAAIKSLKEDHAAEIERLTSEGSAAIAKAEGGSLAVKSEQTSASDQEYPTEEQMLHLMKNNQRVKGIFNANINKRVASETERLNKTITEKDEEVTRLKTAQESASGDEEKEDLRKKVTAAETDKKEAIQKAIENETKKVKVQLSQRDMAQAKLAVVRKAAQETPDKAVKEVWEVADKARPAPKPAAPTTASPATGTPKTAVPPTPTQAQPATAEQTPQAQTETQTQTQTPGQEMTEEEKLKQRQQRFGTTLAAGTSTQPPAKTGSFGQPSAPQSGIRPPSAMAGSFGQPSQAPQAGGLAQPARRPSSTGPNPQAAAFTPSTDGDASAPQLARRTSQQALGRGGLPQPRAGAAAGRGDGGLSIQGAASANPAQRGGVQSGIPRGGPGAGRGARGGTQRGGGQNAGQKRQHEGGDAGDGNKRLRGGGPGGS